MPRLLLPLVLLAFSTSFSLGSTVDISPDDAFISARAAEKEVGKRGVVFLHVGQDEAAYESAHIPGARFLPLSAIATARDGVPFELPPIDELASLFEAYGILNHGRVIIYSDPRRGDLDVLAAARAYFTLDVLGHPYVNIIDGGLEAWRSEGFELSQESSPHDTGVFTAATRPIIVDAEEVAARLSDERTLLVDARPHDQYTGENPGDGIERPGHIPGAVNLFWKEFTSADGTLKSVETLARMWEDAGLDRDDDVIVYCRTGMQASFAYAVARHLGLQPRMYDASYIDWSNNTTLPVEAP